MLRGMAFTFEPIGVIHSCYREKFGIPRQAGLAPQARAELEIFPPYGGPETLRELEGFSHLWVLFVFHANRERSWSPTVRPPRLGGNRRVGVFASRSPFRPNPIGMSAVAFAGIRHDGGRSRIDLLGADLLDGTPVLDLKPYLAWADARVGATGGFAPDRPERTVRVSFTAEAERALAEETRRGRTELRALIETLVGLDPRPSYREDGKGRYAMGLYDFDLHWEMTAADRAVVTALTPSRIG
jgi:tRNA-Thr(GGU) m(6)t(6)A37 methyltransferase TsaA